MPTYEGGAADDALAALGNSIPGVPGEDYPIYAEVPETGFSCEGQVDGGKGGTQGVIQMNHHKTIRQNPT